MHCELSRRGPIGFGPAAHDKTTLSNLSRPPSLPPRSAANARRPIGPSRPRRGRNPHSVGTDSGSFYVTPGKRKIVSRHHVWIEFPVSHCYDACRLSGALRVVNRGVPIQPWGRKNSIRSSGGTLILRRWMDCAAAISQDPKPFGRSNATFSDDFKTLRRERLHGDGRRGHGGQVGEQRVRLVEDGLLRDGPVAVAALVDDDGGEARRDGSGCPATAGRRS
jgi:hypothetical protein